MSGNVVYLDSSAIVKLVIEESQSEALRRFLANYGEHVTSILARVEVRRVARYAGASAHRRAQAVLQSLSILALSDEVATIAGSLEPRVLRSLDAIHLATALLLGPALAMVVTYDDRMISAARLAGVSVEHPA